METSNLSTIFKPRGVKKNFNEPPKKMEDVVTLSSDDEDDDDEKKKALDSKATNSNKDQIVYRNVTVNLHDYKSLELGEYVNDAIVEFYLMYLYNDVLNEPQRNEVHIFSTHFYSKLSAKQKVGGRANSDKWTLAHANVKKWTKKIDLFQKKLIVVPICEE